MNDIPVYDPLSPSVMADPFPTYEQMREKCPVQHVTRPNASYYVLFRYGDVQQAQTDTDHYTSRSGPAPTFRPAGTIFNDGDVHLAFRRTFQSRIMPLSVAKYAPRIKVIVRELIDAMQGNGNINSADLHDAYALPLPVKVIAMLLGVQDTDYRELKQISQNLLEANWQAGSNETRRAPFQIACDFFDYHLDQRYAMLASAGIKDPDKTHVGTVLPDDFLSDMVCATVLGRRLARGEQHMLLTSLLQGGNETTTFLITNCIWRLLEVPERWEQVKTNPDTLITVATEETLRHDPPNLGLWRTTKCPVHLHGETMPANSKVQMSYASANRDPSVFSTPEQFRLDRPLNELRRHMAFGVGAHSCPGSTLARLEMHLTLEAFVERLPNLRLAGPAERVDNYGFWGRSKLPLTW